MKSLFHETIMQFFFYSDVHSYLEKQEFLLQKSKKKKIKCLLFIMILFTAKKKINYGSPPNNSLFFQCKNVLHMFFCHKIINLAPKLDYGLDNIVFWTFKTEIL